MSKGSREPTEAARAWSDVSLADVCSILSGGTPPKSERRYWSGDIPWISGKDMKAPRLRDSIDHVSQEAVESGTRLAPAGSVFLLVRGMGLAKDLPVAVAQRAMAFNQDIKALVPKDLRLGPYIRAAIYHRRDHLLSRIVPSAHGTMTLNLDDVERFQIPMPNDVEEAVAIGATLELIHELQQLAAKESSVSQSLKSSSMQALFTRGLGGEAQKDSALGRIPESWTMMPLERVFKLTSGKERPKDLVDVASRTNPYPVLGGNGVMGYSALWNVDAPTLLIIGRVGEYCGAVHLASGKVWITDNALYAKEWLLPTARLRYAGRFLEYFNLNRFKRLAGQPLVTQGMINEHFMPLPSSEEQDAIVDLIDLIDRNRDAQRRKRVVLDDLFKTLLHKLMTGEIRVADLNLSALAATPATESAA